MIIVTQSREKSAYDSELYHKSGQMNFIKIPVRINFGTIVMSEKNPALSFKVEMGTDNASRIQEVE
jgi:hypothetical protein